MKQTEEELTPYNILEDDTYSEVFIDIERGGSYSKTADVISFLDVYQMQTVKPLTNDHFVEKLSHELEKIREQNSNKDILREEPPYSNSPLTMSICSSRGSSSYSIGADTDVSKPLRHQKPFKKLTYQEVEMSIDKQYTKELKLSSELDILLTYLKGQAHVFSQSNRVTKQKFNMLMFPAIFITGSITVVGPFFDQVSWSGWVLSVLNALLTVLIAMNNFMKWQALAEIFLSISNQYEKLGLSVEMSRNQILFSENVEEKHSLILEKMRETEKRIMDIQYTYNNLVIPYEIQLLNPIISHINIFSFIKKIEQYKKVLIMNYKDVKNEIRYIMFKWEQESIAPAEKKQEEIEKLQSLLKQKEQLKTELIHNNSNNVYAYIDNLFIREIQHSEKYYSYHAINMYLCKPKATERFEYGNPIVDNYLNFIFLQEPMTGLQ
jgi:hypothetical protein